MLPGLAGTELESLKEVSCCRLLTRRVNVKPAARSPSFMSCLFFTRHSPKVVKAASQVLNSMWQYRDLRGLYKKVRFAFQSWPMSDSQALGQKIQCVVITRCVLAVENTRPTG